MFKRIKIERRLVVDSTLFGVLLTLLVAAADSLGLLAPLERWFYDERAALCQHWMPQPTDRLVHLDIDEAALESIGRWPWHRGVLAEILDEVAAAEPKAVALDLLLPDPEEKQYVPGESGAATQIDHDAMLAAALDRLGSALVAARLPFHAEPVTPAYAALRDVLAADPTLEPPAAAAVLLARGMAPADVSDAVGSSFARARREGLFKRIGAEPESLPEKELRAKVLGAAGRFDSPAVRAFDEQLARMKAVRAFQRFALPPLPRPTTLFASSLGDPPIVPFARAASAGGFVDYLQGTDGKVRSVPVFVESNGRVYPQFGVALAMKFLGTDPAAVRIADDHVVVPRPGSADLWLPVRAVPARDLYLADRDVPVVADVSWFGGADWSRMYGRRGAAEQQQQHISIGHIWNARLLCRRVGKNNQMATDAIRALAPEMQELSGKLRQRLESELPFGNDAGKSDALIGAFLDEAEFQEQSLGEADASTLSQRQQLMLKAIKDLRNIRDENRRLVSEIDALRRDFRAKLGGRAVLVGWIATASIADFLPTSLHPRCPGVVLHGVVFNQILTGEVWRTLPPWATLLVTVSVGLLATLAVSFLSPGKAAAAVIALAAGYLALNGFWLFDRNNLVLGVAGPTVALACVWTGGTLAKLGMERWERARITRRFRSYADPKLVDYVLKHPEQNVFEGQVRELTVVYLDLVGFTSLTEGMGAESVQLLNELWGTLVPVIKKNDALVNKFLGDGMMFFFGAPEQSPRHARDAVATIIDVRAALADFNARAAGRGWPPQALRFGISTGTMVVGDSGAPGQGRTDYTVIGDASNLGARLESANKAVGTACLMTARTVELAGEGFLFRPIGKLCVVGKQTGVMTYEVLARTADATEAQKRLAADTAAVVDAFLAGRLDDCVAAIGRMEAAHGPGKLTALYRDRCRHFLDAPANTPFDCQIVLTEK